MKTNNKLHPVNAYVINCISDNLKENYNLDKEPTTDKEKLQFVFDCFKSEVGHNIKRKGKFNAFTSWLQGLPSVLGNLDFSNYQILRIAVEWESLPKNATKKQQDKILENWFPFIANKFFQAANKNKINY